MEEFTRHSAQQREDKLNCARLIFLVFVFSFVSNAYAVPITVPFTNGGFETGNFTNWDKNILMSCPNGCQDYAYIHFDINSQNPFTGTNSAQCQVHGIHTSGEYAVCDLNSAQTVDTNKFSTLHFAYRFAGDGVARPSGFEILSLYAKDLNNGNYYRLSYPQTCSSLVSVSADCWDGTDLYSDNCLAPFNVFAQCYGGDPNACIGGSGNSIDRNWMDTNFGLTCFEGHTLQFKNRFFVAANSDISIPDANMALDDFRVVGDIPVKLINQLQYPAQIFTNDYFRLDVNVTNDYNGEIVRDANVYVNFNNGGFTPAAYDALAQSYYLALATPLQPGDYNLLVNSHAGGFIDANTTILISIIAPPSLSSVPRNPLCKPIVYNGNPNNKIDVVFVGSGFTDLNIFATTVNDFIDYNGTGLGLMSVAPFDTNKTRFNFWRIDKLLTVHPLFIKEDTTFQKNENCSFADQTVLLAVEPRFNSFAPQPLPQAHVFIGQEYLQNCPLGAPNCTYPWPLDIPWSILPNSSCVGSGEFPACKDMGGARGEVIRTFVHEFGHSFGGLVDEYVVDFGLLLDEPPNCAPTPLACNKWSNIPSATCGDYNGCFYSNWIRPYKNTIMNKQYRQEPDFHYDDFNKVNERQLNKQMENFSGSVGGQSAFSYILDFNYSSGSVQVQDVRLVAGAAPNNIAFNGDYKIKLASDSNGVFYDTNFNFPLVVERMLPVTAWDINGVQVDGNSYETLSTTTASAVIPYSEIAKFLRVFDSNNNLLVEKDVSELTPIKFTLGYGGSAIVGQDYNVNYTLISQPVTKLIDGDINVLLALPR